MHPGDWGVVRSQQAHVPSSSTLAKHGAEAIVEVAKVAIAAFT